MTERLYYTDAYLAQFDATVLARADEGRRIYLDRTAFYPASGGQPFDTGRLGGIAVVDVADEGERIAHLLASPLGAAGRVHGQIDWARRFDHMQQHTGQHLLSAVLAELFGLATVSVHFGRDGSTLDLDAGAISPAQVADGEARANALVWENRPVTVSFEDAGGAGGLRKAPDRSGELRIVTIRDLDRSACGGTHVRATGEIGAILIRRVERVRKSVRLEFLCGGRAVRRASADHELLTRLGTLQSAAPDDLPSILETQRAELKAAASARRELEERVAAYRARELYQAAAPDAAGVRRAVVREATGAPDALRALAQAFTALPKAVLLAAVGAPPSVLLAASADTSMDAAAVLRAALAPAGGRGGGSARLAQGTVP
ncbi:MAG TPA: alanyl-tRNA editing protein, partial [Gemmatimonadales bacterium]|nr:alanyl-tRNA editing protein [Gemmatimonadales bacterium]